jgi:hypothetical protein
MKFEAIPILRLEIQNLKHTICQAIGIEGSELEQVIEKAIEQEAHKIIPQVSKIVKDSMEEVITERVRTYFNFGKGRKAIDDAIEKAVKVK